MIGSLKLLKAPLIFMLPSFLEETNRLIHLLPTPITKNSVDWELLTTLGAVDHVNHYYARDKRRDIRVKENWVTHFNPARQLG
jgi:hypothetical protein